MPVSTYEAISTFTLSSDTQFVTVSNIPQNYTDLVIVIDGISTNGTYIRAGFNNGSSVSYVDTLMGTSSPYTPSQFGGTGGFTGLAGGGSRNQIILNFQNYSSNIQNKTYIAETRQGIGASYWSISAGTIATTQPITSLSYWGDSGNVMAGSIVSVYGLSANSLKASGGDIIVSDGTYWYHAFRKSGTFTPASGATLSCDVLTIAGGGGGGGGGGGAGGVLYSASQSISSAQTVTVGAGGTNNSPGSNSVFGSLTAIRGGASDGQGALSNGGSGGGNSTAAAGGTGTAGQGNNGGSGAAPTFGGGGGAGAVGGNGNGSVAGAGGSGISTYATWASATGTGNYDGFYAGGGGGGSGVSNQTTAGAGGVGGGGRGAYYERGFAGEPNTGGGGGGSYGTNGGTGGSGIVIVRYSV